MFYYIEQPCNPSSPIGLVKIDLNHESVEITLVVAVLNVDAYRFWLIQTWPITYSW